MNGHQLLEVDRPVYPWNGEQQNVSGSRGGGVEHLIEHRLQQDQAERLKKTNCGQQCDSGKQLQQKWAHVAQ